MSTVVNGPAITTKARQTDFICNGNEAAAVAIVHCGYDGEGYYPITPSSEVGEEVSKAIAAGQADLSFVVGTSELAAIGICAGMALAGGRFRTLSPSAHVTTNVETIERFLDVRIQIVEVEPEVYEVTLAAH